MRTRAALLGLSLLAVLVVGGPGMVAQVAAATPISSCMMITESGSYELVQNLQGSGGDCLMVQADFVTIDLKGYGIFSSTPSGTAVFAWGRGLVVRGGTIYNFYTAIRGGEGLLVEQMRVVSNSIGVDASQFPFGSAIVKDSVFNDNSQWGVFMSVGVVTNSSFSRNGTAIGSNFWGPGNGSLTISNNTLAQNNNGIQSQIPGASIKNNTIQGGWTALSISCPSHIAGNTISQVSTPLMVQYNNVWDCTFEHNSIRQY